MSNPLLKNLLGAINGHADDAKRMPWYLSTAQATPGKINYGRVVRTSLKHRATARFTFATEQ